jgi:hypothetical protein
MGPTRAVCKDGRCAATRDAADGGPTLVVDAERRLPASACNAWLGCAKVLGSAQNGWLLTGHERTELVGKTVTVAPVCFHDKGTRRCVDAAILPLACVATPPEAQTPPPVCPKR